MPTFSKNGKRLGRPPSAKPTPAAQNAALAKALQVFQARYDAAGRGKRVAGWIPPSSGPNDALSGLQTIRDRARDVVRNDWAGSSAVQKWATSLIGVGITPRFRRVRNQVRKQEIRDLWDDFVRDADADGALNLYGLQTMVVRAWMESGECFVRRRWRFLDEGLPVPTQLQVLEADMLPLFSATTYTGLPANHVIRDGIEFNKRGRRIAYWFYKEHPGDGMTGSPSIGPDTLVRIRAEDVAHIYEPARPGARRGVSVLASVMMRLRKTGDYEDATLERQALANLWVGFITRSLPPFDPNNFDPDPTSGLPRVVDEAGSGLIPLRPGLLQELEDGQDFKFANPPEAGTTYSDYIRTSHLGTSAGAGLPYEVFSGDIKGVSDRAMRVIINEFRRFAEQRQWQIIIPQMCQRVIDWFVDAAVMSGAVALDEAALIRRAEHATHGWAHIHPVQDPQGKEIEVRAGFRSRSSVVGQNGDDPDQVDQERQEDDLREKRLAIGPYAEVLQQPSPSSNSGDPDNAN